MAIKTFKNQLDLRVYYEKGMTIREIATVVKMSPSSVRKQLIENGVDLRKRGPKRIKLSREVIDELYSDKKKNKEEIAKLLKCSPSVIDRRMREWNIPRRTPKATWRNHYGCNRKYNLNEDYFKTWSSNMSWLLGFIYADGCLFGDRITISLSKKDVEILERIKSDIDTDYPLCEYVQNGSVKIALQLCSQKMCNDLRYIGLIPNKTKKIKFPDIPDIYKSDFIRGYMDGDGYYRFNKKQAGLCGASYNFLNKLMNILVRKQIVDKVKIYKEKDQDFWRIHFSQKETKNLIKWLYHNINDKLFLKRKYERVISYGH